MKSKLFFVTLLITVLALSACVVQMPAEAPAEEAPAEMAAGDWGNIDWRMAEGTTLNVLGTAMPVSEVYKSHIPEFEELTGIEVNFELLNDVDRKKRQLVDFSSGTAEFDVGNIGFSNREEFAQPKYLESLEP